jgi:recombination protein RecT
MANTSTTIVPSGVLGNLQSLLLKYKDQIAMAIPEHLTPERLIRVALTAVSQTPKLQECAVETICGCVVQASILGLEPSSELKEAYLVPFYNGKSKRMECQLMPGYVGLVKLARNTGLFSLIDAQPVHANDVFDFQKGSDPWWMHKWERRGDRGAIDGYWGGYVLKDGAKNFEYMTVSQINEHRDKYSKGAYDKDRQLQGPWKDSPDWMYRKTPLKQVLKLAPKSVKLQTAMSLDEHSEAGIPQRFSVDVPLELQPVQEDTAVAVTQQPQERTFDVNAKISDTQRERLWRIVKSCDLDADVAHQIINAHGFQQSSDITQGQYEKLLMAIEAATQVGGQ